MKIDKTVQRETVYITSWVVLLSVLMEAVFLVIGEWDIRVLLGNLLGASAASLNFFLMGIGVQKALGKDEKDAKSVMKLSQMYRNIMLIIVAVLGFVLDCFDPIAVLLPLLFPRIAIMFRTFFDKKQ